MFYTSNLKKLIWKTLTLNKTRSDVPHGSSKFFTDPMGKSSGRDHAFVLVYGSIEYMGLHSPRHKASGRSCLAGMNTPSFPQGEGVHTYPEFVWWSEFHSDHQTWQWKQHETTTLIYRWFQWFPNSNLIYIATFDYRRVKGTILRPTKGTIFLVCEIGAVWWVMPVNCWWVCLKNTRFATIYSHVNG